MKMLWLLLKAGADKEMTYEAWNRLLLAETATFETPRSFSEGGDDLSAMKTLSQALSMARRNRHKHFSESFFLVDENVSKPLQNALQRLHTHNIQHEQQGSPHPEHDRATGAICEKDLR